MKDGVLQCDQRGNDQKRPKYAPTSLNFADQIVLSSVAEPKFSNLTRKLQSPFVIADSKEVEFAQ